MKRSNALAWALVFPTLLITGTFVFLPAIQSLILSLKDIEPFTGQSFFIGLENYQTLWNSGDYWDSIRVTFIFLSLTVVPGIVLSLGIAVALDANPYCQGILRTLFLLPVSISSAMAAMLWIFIYNPTAGILNYVLDSIGVYAPNWTADPRYALIAVSIATVWKELGFNIIFFLAGLSSVPSELKEAALLDGASAWQRFRHVVLPILSPTLMFVGIVSVINSLQSFGQIHILTAGGPIGETNTLVYNLYKDGFVNFRTGLASAEAVILFLIIMLATLLQFRLANRRVHYG